MVLLFKNIAHAPAKIKKRGQDLKSPEIFAVEKVDIIGLFISNSGWKQDSQIILHLAIIVRQDCLQIILFWITRFHSAHYLHEKK